ncbi:MAG: hypothetical protein P4L83_22160 [Nevskia sp.]|nr:hypothetical protein [Nevskia sp.]
MTITSITRKTAILEIFRQCHADKVGSPVLLNVLMVAWTQLGLRGDDLSNGLNEMLEDGSLMLDPDHRNPSVTLTATGKSWLDGVDVDPQVHAEQERILREARQRVENKPPEQKGGQQRWHIVDRRVRLG